MKKKITFRNTDGEIQVLYEFFGENGNNYTACCI